jgi:hypothetical protein
MLSQGLADGVGRHPMVVETAGIGGAPLSPKELRLA